MDNERDSESRVIEILKVHRYTECICAPYTIGQLITRLRTYTVFGRDGTTVPRPVVEHRHRRNSPLLKNSIFRRVPISGGRTDCQRNNLRR